MIGYVISVCCGFGLVLIQAIFLRIQFPNIVYFLVTQFGMICLQSLVWCLPAFVLNVLLQYFQTRCSIIQEENFPDDCKSCMKVFGSFGLCFSNFLFIFFLATQLYNIFMSFLFLANMKVFTMGYLGCIMQVCLLLQIFCNSFWLKTLTEYIDKSFQCLKNLKRKAQEILLMTKDKSERQYIKYMIQKIDEMEPISAAGYFIIDKSTLTSMLSVRYNLDACNIPKPI